MDRDDLDRFLTHDKIVPSSGFVANVMDAVRAEAARPPAIPFPWTRALPGIIAAAVALLATIAGFFLPGSSAAEGASVPLSDLTSSSDSVMWLLVALLLSSVPIVWSLRLMRGPS